MSGDKLTVTDEQFCSAVWDALKGDHNDLRRQQIILEAHRSARTNTTTELVEALRGVVSHFPGEQGPGHNHRVPGVWDEDNHPALAGTKCEWCAHWEKVKALTLHDRALGK
jgi:hypothetical protein